TQRLRAKQGIVINVLKRARQHSYDVRWDDGIEQRVVARSIGTLPAICAEHGRNLSLSDLLRNEKDNSESGDGANVVLHSEQQVECGGRIWVPCDQFLTDPRAIVYRPQSSLHWRESLELGEKTHTKDFYLMYSMITLKQTISGTSKAIESENRPPRTTAEYFRWLGIRLVMEIDGGPGSYRRNWEKDVASGCVDTPRNYGDRYHMSLSRFEKNLYALRFDDGDNNQESDSWSPIRPLIVELNRRHQVVIHPGDMLVVDECMAFQAIIIILASQQNQDSKKASDSRRRIDSIADRDTGILLGLEIMEGKLKQKQKTYAREYGEGTSIVLRLTKPYTGSGRTVVADSAFASVKTLVQLEAQRGLYFMGIVKTATAEFPKATLKAWFDTKPERGSFKLLHSKAPSQTDIAWDNNYRCNLCSKVYTRGNGYTNRLSHLRTSHAGFERVTLDVIGRDNRIASDVDAKSIEIYQWVEWCILERMSFSFCESAIVRKNAKMAPISRDTLKEYLLKLYGWTREKVIQQLPERFGLVVDGL
ncbi:TPA: hypothetical protein N0F65_010194, partial [Lagenidium giganteum]